MGSINYLSTFRAPAFSNVPTTCSGFFLIIRYYMNPYLPYCSSSFMPFWILRFTSFNDIICYWSICFSKFNHPFPSLLFIWELPWHFQKGGHTHQWQLIESFLTALQIGDQYLSLTDQFFAPFCMFSYFQFYSIINYYFGYSYLLYYY